MQMTNDIFYQRQNINYTKDERSESYRITIFFLYFDDGTHFFVYFENIT
jgi:hypothetical protein